MYLFILWPFYLLLNLWAFMFCYIFSIQLKKPQSWHRMKKSHKVKKHKERFNCLFLIFFQHWDKFLMQTECLTIQWGQRKCTPGTPPSSWALTTAQSKHIPRPGLTDARDGANPLPTPPGSPQATETGFLQRLHTACAAAMHKLTRVLYPNTSALSDLPSVAAKCWALINDSKWG